jgi:hypothetical protein
MSFDQFNEDQVLNLDYADNNGRRQTGFSVDDRFDVDIHDLVVQRDSIGKMADTIARAAALGRLFAPRNGVPGLARRVFLGRDPAKEALLSLSDRNGKARIRLVVDSLGTPSLEFLDAAGAVTARLPEAKK